MKLLTKAIETKLRANSAQKKCGGDYNTKPVVKFFGGSACTWLISELDEDGDSMFGLCDLGMGSPEMGYVSLKELQELKFRPFGLGVERDLHFKANKTLVEYADEARAKGRIMA